MRRQITGLHAADRCAADQIPDGLFLVRIQRVQFRRYAQKPYYTVSLSILEPRRFAEQVISSRLYCSLKALWKLNWSCATLATIPNCWAAMKSMKANSSV
jgi:hypothetical protein